MTTNRSNSYLSIRAVANKDGTVTFPLSSEEPYRRYDGVEILAHGADNVDLSFLNSGNAPLLDNHDRWSGVDKQIGVIVRAWIEASRVYVMARFSAKAHAQEILKDVTDGIIRNVSVGYEVLKTERDEDGDTYRVTRWKPVEASFVPVPADPTVGIGRSANRNGVKAMPLDRMPGQMTEAEQGAALESALNEIRSLASTHNIGHLGESFVQAQIRAGLTPSIEVFRGIARSAIPEGTALRNEDIGLTPKETRRFSILKLARAMVDGATKNDLDAAAFEIEASYAARAQADKDGRKTSGAYTLPADVMGSWGDFEVDGVRSAQYRAAIGTSAGANILDTAHLAGRFIDNLRNASSVMRAGATMLSGLDGNVEIPGGQANNAAAWLASEDANVAESNPTFRKITLGPKDLGSYTDLTRRMLQQSTIDIEAYVRRQITDGIILEIDRAGLYGTGATGQPTGLNATAGIGSVAFAATATTGIPTRDELIDMGKLIAATNRGTDSLKWLMNTGSVGDLQKTRVDAGSGIFLINDAADRLVDKPLIESNQIPLGPTFNDIWLGYWSDMIIGMWGSLDLDRDTAAKFLSGGIRLRGIQTVDVAVARVGSFTKGT
jgi:HK97 family phage major capsid protein/HK97 family phage prohead protease